MGKIGVVKPDAPPAEAPKLGVAEGVGIVKANEANRPVERPPLGVVPASENVVSVTPQQPQAQFGVVHNIVTKSPPPPPGPKPLGVMEPEATFPTAFVPPKPQIGAVREVAVTPAAVAAQVPEKPGADTVVVVVPRVVSPLEGREEKK